MERKGYWEEFEGKVNKAQEKEDDREVGLDLCYGCRACAGSMHV